MGTLRQLFAMFTLSKKRKTRRTKTRRNKKKNSRRRFMRGGWGEPAISSMNGGIVKKGIMKGGWGGAVPVDVQIQ